MKVLLSLLVSLSSIHCFAQDIAVVTSPVNEHFLYSPTNYAATAGREHKQTTLGTVGTWTMLGGAVITIVGYAEVKNATTTDGPFTFVDQSKINVGHAAEYVGVGLFTAGLTMIIIDAVNRHHGGSKVSMIAPKRNEMGVAVKF